MRKAKKSKKVAPKSRSKARKPAKKTARKSAKKVVTAKSKSMQKRLEAQGAISTSAAAQQPLSPTSTEVQPADMTRPLHEYEAEPEKAETAPAEPAERSG